MKAMRDTYHDTRSGFWHAHFERALPYDRYLSASGTAHAKKWSDFADKIPALTHEQKARVSGYGRTMNVLVYSGAWCGDCVRQGPMVERIGAAAGPAVTVRFIERDTSPELQEELRVLGALRVPIVVFLSEDWFEVGRFGDRLLTSYRSKAAREIGPACDSGILPPPQDQLVAEQEDWVGTFERMLLMLRLSPPLRERYGD